MPAFETLDSAKLADLFGFPAEAVAAAAGAEGARLNRHYRPVEGEPRDQVLLDVLRRVFEGELRQVGEHRQGIWETCWGELKDTLEQEAFGLAALAPEFMTGFRYFRMAGAFVEPEDPNLFYGLTRLLLRTLYAECCRDTSCLYEFGCGSGHNLLPFMDLFPDKRCVGLDWSPSAVAVVEAWGAAHGFRAQGRSFDFFNPDYTLDLLPGSTVLTCTALEQVNDRHGPFLDYLLAKKPALCINVEPIAEFYDPDNLLDHLAASYHTRRRYLSGYYPALQALEREGRVQILKARRVRLGNLFNECFSYLVWRTL